MTHRRALLAITLFALPLFLVFLGSGDARAMMELFNLVPVREAVRDGHWLVPTLNGAPRLEKPPLPVWLPGALAVLCGHDNLWVVRLPSVLVGLMTCWAVYGIGCLLGSDRKWGFWAALVLAANLIFIRQARLASYDIFSTGFIMVGFLGLVGLAEMPARRWLWIALAGVGLGLAFMSKGPVPLATVCVPYALWVLIFHRRRWDIWLSLLGGAVLSAAVFLPWLLAAAAQQPQAWLVWRGEFLQFTAAEGEEYRAVWYYYLCFFLVIFPWTVSLIGGLALPLFPARSEPRPTAAEMRGRWLLLLVLVLGVVMLSIPHEKKQRYILQQVPIAALLIAALWLELQRLPHHTPLDWPAKLLLQCQAAVTIGMGVAVLLMIAAALLPADAVTHGMAALPPGMRKGLIEAPAALHMAVATLGVAGWLAIGLAVLALGVVAALAQGRRRFAAAFLCHLLAAWVAMFAGYWTYRIGGYQVSEYRADAEALSRLAGPNPIYSLPKTGPWLYTIYYANRTMPETAPAQIIAAAQQWTGPVFVLVRDGGQKEHWDQSQAVLAQIAAGTGRPLAPAMEFQDGHPGTQKLFRLGLHHEAP